MKMLTSVLANFFVFLNEESIANRNSPNVAFPWKESLGNSHGVKQGAAYVKYGHENEPTQGS